MNRRALLGLVLAGAILGGVAAYLYYFAWAAPLLDGERIDRFAYGPRGSDIRELVIFSRVERGETLERLVNLVNQAPLTTQDLTGQGTGFVVVLLREDNLQYRLIPGDRGNPEEPGLVGIAEGGEEYLGTLVFPELAREIAALEARGDGVRTQ